MHIPGLHLEGDLSALPWRATSDPGVSWLPLYLEEAGSAGARRGGGVVLIRMEPGCGYAPHRHLGCEDVLVLQGGYRDELGEYSAGEHVHYPPGSVHSPLALGERGGVEPRNPTCVLYATVPQGIELLQRDP